jgi:adenosylmethionine-8-amino-7-oxononanoate aminotransferase
MLQPDMLLFAKGIASGVPFAGVSAKPHLYDKMSPGMMVGGDGLCRSAAVDGSVCVCRLPGNPSSLIQPLPRPQPA